jgi:hypothetical protein
MDAKEGNVAAARVHSEKMRVVLSEGKGALRFEGIVIATAAASPCGKVALLAQSAVGVSFVGDDLVAVGGIGHDKDGWTAIVVPVIAMLAVNRPASKRCAGKQD